MCLAIPALFTGCGWFDGGGRGPEAVTLANLSIMVRDACDELLPGVWVAVQDQMTTYFYRTTETDIEREFVNLRAPYVVTFAYPVEVAGFPKAQSFMFRTDMTMKYRIPVNSDQCPPPPPPTPTYGAIEGTLTDTPGDSVFVYCTGCGNSVVPSIDGSFTFSNVPTGKRIVYAFERDGQGKRTRFGLTRVEVRENQTTETVLDLSAQYSLHLTGELVYPSGFTPDTTPFPPSINASLSVLGAGFITDIGEEPPEPPVTQFDILLPDFSAVALDPATDQLSISANAAQTLDTRGTPTNADDWRRSVSWWGNRLIGQILSGQPLTIQFSEPATAESPSDGATVSRAGLKLKWRPPATGEPFSYIVQLMDPQTKRIFWNISSANIGYTEITLPVFPGGYDPLPLNTPVQWGVYASFANSSSSDFGLIFTATP